MSGRPVGLGVHVESHCNNTYDNQDPRPGHLLTSPMRFAPGATTSTPGWRVCRRHWIRRRRNNSRISVVNACRKVSFHQVVQVFRTMDGCKNGILEYNTRFIFVDLNHDIWVSRRLDLVRRWLLDDGKTSRWNEEVGSLVGNIRELIVL